MGTGEIDSLLDAELWQLSDAQLIEAVPALTEQIHRLQTLRAGAVGEIDHRRVVPDPAHPALKHWLANTPAGMLSMPEASRVVLLARLLREQPDLGVAYESGGLRADLAVLIGAFCENPPKGMPEDIVPDIRKKLIDQVSHGAGDAATLRKSITDLRDAFAQTPPAEDTDRNGFYASQTLNGRVVIKGDVDSETGEMLLTALSKLSAPVPGPHGEPDPRPAALRRANAFTEMLRRILDFGVCPVEGGDKPHITVLVNQSDLHDCDDQHNTDADRKSYEALFTDRHGPQMLWTGPLSRASTRRLACDCVLTPIVIDTRGVPLTMGRTKRLAPAHLRKALIARDRCCAFPGCGRPAAWTDAHHVIHWADGGETDLSNTVLLCRSHHQLIHHSDWEVFIGPDLCPWFRPPRSRDPDRKPLPAHGRTAA